MVGELLVYEAAAKRARVTRWTSIGERGSWVLAGSGPASPFSIVRNDTRDRANVSQFLQTPVHCTACSAPRSIDPVALAKALACV